MSQKQERLISMGGPVGSPYPGTPVMVVFVLFLAFVIGKCVLLAYRRRQDVTTREVWQAPLAVAIMATFLLASALWAVWVHARQ